MRELVFTMVTGNPDIKPENKPMRKDEIIKLSIDEVGKKEKKKKEKVYTPEEIESIRQELINKLNGTATKPDSKN